MRKRWVPQGNISVSVPAVHLRKVAPFLNSYTRIEKNPEKQGRNDGFEAVRREKTEKRPCETNPRPRCHCNPFKPARTPRPGLNSPRIQTAIEPSRTPTQRRSGEDARRNEPSFWPETHKSYTIRRRIPMSIPEPGWDRTPRVGRGVTAHGLPGPEDSANLRRWAIAEHGGPEFFSA